jgi:hypothetical protein
MAGGLSCRSSIADMRQPRCNEAKEKGPGSLQRPCSLMRGTSSLQSNLRSTCRRCCDRRCCPYLGQRCLVRTGSSHRPCWRHSGSCRRRWSYRPSISFRIWRRPVRRFLHLTRPQALISAPAELDVVAPKTRRNSICRKCPSPPHRRHGRAFLEDRSPPTSLRQS